MTAKEVYLKHTQCVLNHADIKTAMIEFAKMHVEAALKAASEKALVRRDTFIMSKLPKTELQQMFNYSNGTSHYVDKDSILNSYPLNKIK
jgi:hypothetical protein